MFKYKHTMKIILSLFSILIFIFSLIYFVQKYSLNIGLFDDVDIKISGNDYINSQHIEKEIYPHISSSLLSINLTDMKNNLESIDYIKAVQVSRILPNTLMIHIIERLPRLLIAQNDEITFMDGNGVLLPANEKSIGTFPVPVLSILNEDVYTDIYMGDIAQLLYFLLNEYSLFYKNLSEIKIYGDVWEFYSDNNTKIYAHASYLKDQLIILKNFENTVYPVRYLQDYHYIDLRIKDQVIVKEKYRKG